MSTTIAPFPQFVGLDNDGSPLVGGFVDTYLAGTTTPTPTYTDLAGLVPNTNPIVLDGGGRAVIRLGALSYKFRVRRANGTIVYTQDDIASVSVLSNAASTLVFDFGGAAESPIANAAYPAGATVAEIHAGTALLVADPAGLAGAVLEAMVKSPGGGTVSIGMFNLSDGSPNTVMTGSELTSTSAVGERKVSGAITYPAGGVAKTFAIKVKSSGGGGFVWGLKLRVL